MRERDREREIERIRERGRREGEMPPPVCDFCEESQTRFFPSFLAFLYFSVFSSSFFCWKKRTFVSEKEQKNRSRTLRTRTLHRVCACACMGGCDMRENEAKMILNLGRGMLS